jgi:hypothetical protein
MPLFDASAGYGWALGIVYCVLACVFSIGWKALTKLDSAERFYQEFAYISAASFVILPATATYHALLLVPALLLHLAPCARFRGFALVTLLSYCAIGVWPYSWTSGFVMRGWLLVFAYPRLWLVTVMFFAMTAELRARASLVQARGIA